MPTSYTSLLGLALPVTGELAGTWGDTVNDYISKYVDSSVAGTQTISGSQTAVTLTRANGAALSQAGSGATGSSQYQVINCTGNPAGTLTVTIDVTTGSPTLSNSTYSQTFAVINGTSTSQSVVVRATTTSGTSTGTTLVSGEKALIAWNGSDFIKVATSAVDGVSTISFGTTGLTPSTATSGAVTVAGTLVAANGGTGQSTYTTGDLLYATGSTALSKLGIGTNGQILTSTGTAPQWSTLSGVAVTTFSAGTTGFTPSSATSGAVTLAGTLATTNGGTGLTSFTANGVVYASSTSALTTGSALTFDGTNLGVGVTPTANQGRIQANGAGQSWFKFYDSNAGWNFGTFYKANGTTALAYLGSGGGNAIAGATVDDFVVRAEGNLVFTAGGGTEAMRLTSTGLGIGTSSNRNSTKLDVRGNISFGANASYYGQIGYDAGVGALDITSGDGAFRFIRQSGLVTSATLDSSGNLGLGVTPSAWISNQWSVFEGAYGGALAFYKASNVPVTVLTSNAYNDGGWKYKTTDPALQYEMDGNVGIHKWYTAPSGTAGNTISFTQAMTLDASGRLLVGLTSSSGGSRLEVKSSNNSLAIFTGGDASGTSYFVNTNGSGQVNHYATWATAPGVNAYHAWWVTASGGTQTQAMTLDASGNLAVGATSTSYRMEVVAPSGDNITALFRSGDATAANNAGGGFRSISSATAASRIAQLWLDADGANFSGLDYFYISKVGNSGDVQIWQQSNAAMTFATNGTERARITSGGELLVGSTSGSWTGNDAKIYSVTSSGWAESLYTTGSAGGASIMRVDDTGAIFISFRYTSTSVGSITTNGTATAYNTSSDYRLKNNTQPLTGSGAFIDALKPKTWNWATDGSKGVGFIAHEVQEVSPGSVVGTKDAVDEEGKPVYQAMEYGSAEFIANIIAELQSLRARVAQLEAK